MQHEDESCQYLYHSNQLCYSRFDLNVVCEKKESRTINCVEQNKCEKIFIFIDTFIYRKLYKPEVHNVESSDHCQQLHLEGNNFIQAKWGGGKHQSDSREKLHYNAKLHQRSHIFQGEHVKSMVTIIKIWMHIIAQCRIEELTCTNTTGLSHWLHLSLHTVCQESTFFLRKCSFRFGQSCPEGVFLQEGKQVTKWHNVRE